MPQPHSPTDDELQRIVDLARPNILAAATPRRRKHWRFIAPAAGAAAIFGVGTFAGVAAAGGLIDGDVGAGTSTIVVAAPEGPATDLRVSFTCLDDAEYKVTVPTDPTNGLTLDCSDNNGQMATGTTDFALNGSLAAQDVQIATTAGSTFTIETSYIAYGPHEFPRNASGQSYGKIDEFATNHPDLIFVAGTTTTDVPIQGYVLATDIALPELGDPTASMEWVDSFRAENPDGKSIPLYASDGLTVLGSYRLFH